MEENSDKNIFDYTFEEYLKLPTEEATKLAEKNKHEFEEWCKKYTPEIEGDHNKNSFGDHPYFSHYSISGYCSNHHSYIYFWCPFLDCKV